MFYICEHCVISKNKTFFCVLVCKPTSEDTMEGYFISSSPICWRNHYAHYGKLDCERTHRFKSKIYFVMIVDYEIILLL